MVSNFSAMRLRYTLSVVTGLLTVFFLMPAVAQETCKVLMPEIAQKYEGKCKKGLAHGRGIAQGKDTYKGSFKHGLPDGKGTYTWSTGERYEGDWKFGKREGVGTYFYKDNDGQAVMKTGIWIDNQYAGPVPEKPKVITATGIERYSFQRQSNGNRVQISTYINGISNCDLLDLTFFGSSGSEFKSGNTMGYEAIIFPFTCKITYYSWNKSHTVRNFTRFEFVIKQPGRWQVVIHNN